MIDDPLPTFDLLEGLGVVVLELLGDGTLTASTKPLPWFEEQFGSAGTAIEHSDFLEHFLSEAKDHWEGAEATSPLKSGYWEQGGEQFEATAIQYGDRHFLSIDRGGEEFGRYANSVQRSNELALGQAMANRETQRRIVLLDCLIHDLSNPLASVLVNLQFLAKKLPEGAEQRAAALALEQVQRQREMLRSVVGLFSAGSDTTPTVGAVDVDVVVGDAVRAQLDNALQAGVGLSAKMGSAPQAIAEESYLLRAIENLIVNAIRHSPRDSEIQVSVAADAAGVTIDIRDHGPGVDEDMLPVLFDPFQRGRQAGGLAGLGLFFCKRVVERWGGELSYADAKPSGARFTIRLCPAGQESED